MSASGEKYEKLDNPSVGGDKDVLIAEEGARATMPNSESEGSGQLSGGEFTSLKKPQNLKRDKDVLIAEEGARATMPNSESEGSGQLSGGEFTSLKKPKKVFEASKAVLQDQSRGLKIIIICAFVFSLAITVALILSIYLGPPQVGANAAVAADVKECSNIGLQMIQKGGNAVDAAVAAMFCVGVVNAESSGIGGGGFMLIHDHKVESSEVIDFRETAPSETTQDMYRGELAGRMKLGTQSIGVPGELKGMETAHQKYGKLSWYTVVQPSADLARNGFKMTGHTANILRHPKFKLEEFMKSGLKKYYTNADGSLKRANDTIKRPDLARTLDKIASDGADTFYTGSVADDIIKTIANQEIPGIMRKSDLKNYKVEHRDVVKTAYHGFTIESIPAPGSGPVLLSIMNFLEGYNIKQDNMTYHRMLEAFKYGYAQKERLGDPMYNSQEIGNASNIMISKEEAKRLRNMTSNVTHEALFYDHLFSLPEDKGTTHISVIDPAELFVSVTSTINDWFGSMIVTDGGIVLNNQLADFNEVGKGNKFNAIQPGKRPLSSMAPTVVYETGHLCGLRMVCGGANGSRIITGIAQTIFNNLSLSMTLQKSIDHPRLHNQFEYPDAEIVEAEVGFPESILSGLTSMGHDIQMVDKKQSLVNAVLKVKDNIEAYADARKQGASAAIFM